MKASEFCYWLQGYFEISGVDIDTMLPKEMNCLQVQVVQKHLSMVFKHELDKTHGTLEEQATLQAMHDKPKVESRSSLPPFHEIWRC